MPSPNPNLTTNFKLPSPTPSDPPDVPGDIKALADRLDDVLMRPAGAIHKDANTTTTQALGSWYVVTGLAGGPAQGGVNAGASGLTVPKDGIYRISAMQRTRCMTQAVLHGVAAQRNGQNLLAGYAAGMAGENATPMLVGYVRLSANDNVRLAMYGNGHEVTIYGGSLESQMTVEWVGP